MVLPCWSVEGSPGSGVSCAAGCVVVTQRVIRRSSWSVGGSLAVRAGGELAHGGAQAARDVHLVPAVESQPALRRVRVHRHADLHDAAQDVTAHSVTVTQPAHLVRGGDVHPVSQVDHWPSTGAPAAAARCSTLLPTWSTIARKSRS